MGPTSQLDAQQVFALRRTGHEHRRAEGPRTPERTRDADPADPLDPSDGCQVASRSRVAQARTDPGGEAGSAWERTDDRRAGPRGRDELEAHHAEGVAPRGT